MSARLQRSGAKIGLQSDPKRPSSHLHHLYRIQHLQLHTATQNAAKASQDPPGAMEFAGNACIRSSPPLDIPSTPQLDADTYWNADTRATSHMTPQKHWLR